MIIAGNSIQTWALAFGLFGLVLLLLRILQTVLLQRLAAFAESTETVIDDLVVELFRKKKLVFNIAIASLLPLNILFLSERADLIAYRLIALALLFQGGIWAAHFVSFVLTQQLRGTGEDPSRMTALNAIKFISRIVVWTLVLLLSLDNLGFDITALIAGLGVGGIAVALAAQNILGDLFASLSIVLDKPFVLGDAINVGGDFAGTVEYIGLKTTRVRSVTGEELIFSNTDLLQSRIRNFKRMTERRVLFTLGVTYDTPHIKLAAIPGMLKEIIEERPQTRFDRAHFMSYGDSSINFEVVYFVKDPDFNTYADIHQAVNMAIHQRFEKENIGFAFPTRTLYVHQAK